MASPIRRATGPALEADPLRALTEVIKAPGYYVGGCKSPKLLTPLIKLTQNMNAIQPKTKTASTPSLTLIGTCGYEVRNDRVIITIGEIANQRDPGDLSGTLSVELWALERPYAGGQFTGTTLAGTRIGELFGQHFLSDCRYDLLFQEPAAGSWHLTLMLREWTHCGYETRDFVNFATPYVVGNKPAVIRSETDNVINVEFAQHNKTALPNTADSVPAMAAVSRQQDLTPETTVSINTASLEELATVKGLPKKAAENIVASRPYASIDEVLKVKGMGAKLLEKVRKFIRL